MVTKSKSTRPRKAASRPNPAPAKAPQKRPRKARMIQFHFADALRMDLIGIRAAAVTAIVALDGKGVHGDVSLSLRRHVLNPIEEIMATLENNTRGAQS